MPIQFSPPLTLRLKSEQVIYQSQVRCHVNENEFNMTQNPSAIVNTTNARATILIEDVGVPGATIQVYVIDPDQGQLLLGSYTSVATDTATDTLATNIAAALSTNPYGYIVVAAQNVVTIVARPGLGSRINGGTNLIVNITLYNRIFDVTFETTFN